MCVYMHVYDIRMNHIKSTLTNQVKWAVTPTPFPAILRWWAKANMIGIPVEDKLDEVVPSKDPKEPKEPEPTEKTLPKAPEPNNKTALTEEGSWEKLWK